MENIDCELEVTKRSYKHYISVDSGDCQSSPNERIILCTTVIVRLATSTQSLSIHHEAFSTHSSHAHTL